MDSGAEIYAVDFAAVTRFIHDNSSSKEFAILAAALNGATSNALSEELSQQFAEVIKKLGTETADLRTAVEDTKIYSLFQKKWYKIVFDSNPEIIAAADSGQFQNLNLNKSWVRGSIPRKYLASLKKVDELYAYLKKDEDAVKANMKSVWGKDPEPPKLILSSSEVSEKASSGLIFDSQSGTASAGTSSGKLISATGEELSPETKLKREPRPKQNELQKEEGQFYAGYRTYEDLSRELVRGVFKTKDSGLDLVILTRKMEILT